MKVFQNQFTSYIANVINRIKEKLTFILCHELHHVLHHLSHHCRILHHHLLIWHVRRLRWWHLGSKRIWRTRGHHWSVWHHHLHIWHACWLHSWHLFIKWVHWSVWCRHSRLCHHHLHVWHAECLPVLCIKLVHWDVLRRRLFDFHGGVCLLHPLGNHRGISIA